MSEGGRERCGGEEVKLRKCQEWKLSGVELGVYMIPAVLPPKRKKLTARPATTQLIAV